MCDSYNNKADLLIDYIESCMSYLGISSAFFEQHINNILWKYIINPSTDLAMPQRMRSVIKLREQRAAFIKEYSWAIPSQEALSVISQYSPLIEIGAGTGYWCKLLQDAEVDIVAYDSKPPCKGYNVFHNTTTHTKVQKGGPPIIKQVSRERTLFLCWPPYGSDMAFQCLANYRGRYLIYIGEGYGGCTANDIFHEKLEEEWREIECIDIPQWLYIHDRLIVYERK